MLFKRDVCMWQHEDNVNVCSGECGIGLVRMKREMSVLLCALVMFAKSTASLDVISQVKHVKCCPEGQRLDSSLRKCQKFLHLTKTNDSMQDPFEDPAQPLIDLAAYDGGGDDDGGGIHGHMPNCSSREMLLLTTNSRSRYQWLDNGSLALKSETARARKVITIFSPKEFCVDDAEGLGKAQAMILCPCDKVKCVNKCCPWGYIKRCSNFECFCEESKAKWNPFHSDNELPPGVDVTYEVLDGNEPICTDGKSLWIDNPSFKPQHYTQYWWKYPGGYLFNDMEVCGDFVLFDNQRMYQTIGYCYAPFLFKDMYTIATSLRFLPALLLAITLVVLIFAPERRLSIRGWIHSKALLCHAGMLLMTNSIIASYVVFKNDATAYCRIAPFMMYFSLVAAAFWLNAICINMAWGFGRPRGPYGDKPGAGRRAFLYYSLYAWGSSLFMTSFALAMWFSRDVPRGWLRPTLMETRSCFWEDKNGAGKMGTFAYFYGPVGTLLVVNASLFIFISVRVRQLRRRTSILNRDTDSQSRLQSHRQALLYVRIIWLMGVGEMAVEMAAWAQQKEGYSFHVAAEFIDFLRVVSIFVLCVCKRRTMVALRNRILECRLSVGIRESWSLWKQHTQQDQVEMPQSRGGHARDRSRSFAGSNGAAPGSSAEPNNETVTNRSVGTSSETASTVCEVVETPAPGIT